MLRPIPAGGRCPGTAQGPRAACSLPPAGGPAARRRRPSSGLPASRGQQQEPGGVAAQGEQGTVLGSALLIAGTTVGAGILALPAVTQDAGFVPTVATLTGCCGYSIVTGLLLAEVNLAIRQRRTTGGNGGGASTSLISMARATLGEAGALAASAAYVFLHYALLVAYVSKAGEIVSGATGLPLLAADAAFASAFAGLCYGSSQRALDAVNGALVGLVVVSFVGLLGVAGSAVDVGSLARDADWAEVPATLPVVALSFVFHNVIGVVCTSLGGDVPKIRSAICAGVAIPWAMFVLWDGAILGSLDSLSAAASAAAPAATTAAAAAAPTAAAAARQPAPALVQQQAATTLSGGQGEPVLRPPPAARRRSHIDDPLAALLASDSPGTAALPPLIKGFSFLAIATSYIGFILGLTDFLADALALPEGGAKSPLPYALTVLPPFAVAVSNPDIFLQALDTAGTYGVLTLFGVLPAAMAWSVRRGTGGDGAPGAAAQGEGMVPGGEAMLLAVAGAAAAVIAREAAQLLGGAAA